MFRNAQKEDLDELIRLFTGAFGGTEAFAKMVMEQFAGFENVFAAQRGERLAACLCAVPVTLKEKKGAYYYGVCTDKEWQGQGIMTDLMRFAQEKLQAEGAEFAVLIPAGEALFDFYAQRGFQKAFAKRQLERKIPNNLWAVAEFDTITAKGLEALRKKYMPNSVMFRSSAYVEVLTDLYSGGLTTLSTENGYGLYFKRNERLEFIELFAKTDRDAEYLLEAARQKESVDTALVQLGRCQNLFLGEGALRDYGMIQFFGPDFDADDCYMRLMLDDE